MDRLITPWRREYVTSGSPAPGCVFCGAAEGRDGAEELVVHRGQANFVVMNLYPYGAGHVMVAPYRHVGRLAAATPEELGEMMTLAREVERVFTEVYRPDGINLGMNLGRAAGAGIVDHIHLHLVPRWYGDSNFMTAVGETRVIPEDPVEACARLRTHFAR